MKEHIFTEKCKNSTTWECIQSGSFGSSAQIICSDTGTKEREREREEQASKHHSARELTYCLSLSDFLIANI